MRQALFPPLPWLLDATALSRLGLPAPAKGPAVSPVQLPGPWSLSLESRSLGLPEATLARAPPGHPDPEPPD